VSEFFFFRVLFLALAASQWVCIYRLCVICYLNDSLLNETSFEWEADMYHVC